MSVTRGLTVLCSTLACIRGAELVPAEAGPGVEALIADGAVVTAFVESDVPFYHTNGTVLIPSWSRGTERAFLVLHEVCHAHQWRTHLWGDDWLAGTDEGRAAAALGMDHEHAADVCALHYLGLTEIPVPSSRREPGYLTGAVPSAWLAWARDWLP